MSPDPWLQQTRIGRRLDGIRVVRPLYPEALYPDARLPLIITQSIQITAYLVGAAGGLVLACVLGYERFQLWRSETTDLESAAR